jgi:sigma-B regulation protein RsbU (phosphoserine phosphatase)
MGMIIADVAGKGLSAALLMASLQAYVRSHATLRGENCAEMATTLNSLLYQTTDSAHFATVFYAVYDDATRVLHYFNAGHFPPILVRSSGAALAVSVTESAIGARDAFLRDPRKAVCPLDADSHPLGLFDSLDPRQQRLELNPGDWIISYSDGLTEAVNLRGEEFGLERLVETVVSHQETARSAAHMLDTILVAVRSHTGDTPQADDLTLLVARVL